MTRIAFQILLILLPFLLFALYRLSTTNKRTFHEQWPFAALTFVGIALSAIAYLVIFLNEPRGERTCATPPRFENGKIIEGEVVPCENPSVDERKGKGLFGKDED